MLLILASPHVLSEHIGAGARPVHPIRDAFAIAANVRFRLKQTFFLEQR